MITFVSQDVSHGADDSFAGYACWRHISVKRPLCKQDFCIHQSWVCVTAWLTPTVHRLWARHQSDNWHASLADCLTDVDTVISTSLIRCETCNVAGGRFYWKSCQIRLARLDIDPSLLANLSSFLVSGNEVLCWGQINALKCMLSQLLLYLVESN